MKAMTTLIAVVGARAEPVVRSVATRSSNVTFEALDDLPDDPVECSAQLQAAWTRAARHSSVFTAVAADPLLAVVREWAKRLRGDDHELETAIGLTQPLPSPDFWIVDDGLPDPEIHWYADYLVAHANRRVILSRIDPPALEDRIGSLPAGRQPPPPQDLAAGARGYVPVPSIEVADAADTGDHILLAGGRHVSR